MDTSSSSTRKGFLDLPAELRVYIYELILVSDVEVHMIRHSFKKDKWRGWRICKNQVAAVWGTTLLRANRQIHAEMKPILYGDNTFIVNGRDGLKCFAWEVLPHLRKIKFEGPWSRLHDLLAELEYKAAKLRALESLVFTVDVTSIVGPRQHAWRAKLLLPLFTAFMVARKLEIQDTVALISFTAEPERPHLFPSESMIALAAHCTEETRRKAGELLQDARWVFGEGFDELSGTIR